MTAQNLLIQIPTMNKIDAIRASGCPARIRPKNRRTESARLERAGEPNSSPIFEIFITKNEENPAILWRDAGRIFGLTCDGG